MKQQQRTPNPNFTFDLDATLAFAALLIPKGRSVRQAWYEAASHQRWLASQIGPRRVGGIYRTYYGDTYEVLELDRGPRTTWPVPWQITVRTLGESRIRRHCTAWDDRDRVIATPEDPECPAVTEAWGHWLAAGWNAHVNFGEAVELRHVLEELAHPATIQAFHRLASTAHPATITATEAVR
jgi:hypothetical protein